MRLRWILLLAIHALHADVVMMNPATRLKGNISVDALSRLAVVNDRITQVFGGQDAYEMVIDETMGQVFIKPTVANGTQPISLSFITESKCTQDLLLIPSAMEGATLLFRNPSSRRPVVPAPHGEVHKGSHEPAPLWDVMKLWVLEEESCSDATNPPLHRSHPGCVTELMTWKRLDGHTVSRWSIRNDTSTPLEIVEKDFYRSGDQALALDQTTLGVGEETILYVVSEDDGEESS